MRSAGRRRLDNGPAFAETNWGGIPALCPGLQQDLIAIQEKGADFPGGQFDRVSPVAADFQQTAVGVRGGTGDGAAAEQVTGP